jgi:hypothetical protein
MSFASDVRYTIGWQASSTMLEDRIIFLNFSGSVIAKESALEP